jgi:CheY-like chemotaxis protein
MINMTTSPVISKDQINFRGMRILVVDDDTNSREMLSEVLRLYDAEVKTADSVPVARNLYQTWKPALLISDVGMPGEDGYDLIRSIRSFPQGSNVKAIAITGYARDKDRDLAFKAGYDLFLSKPVDLEQLIDLIWENKSELP